MSEIPVETPEEREAFEAMIWARRARVVREALTWLRTPYHHAARVRGAGVDCGQFPLAVFEAAGVLPHIEPEPYVYDWNLHQEDRRYIDTVERHASPLPEGAAPLPGDIALFRVGRSISHGAIVVEWPVVVHAYQGVGVTLDDVTQHKRLGSHFVGVWRPHELS